ncbi:MAG TPA: hypothetical protein P5089_01090 [Candidatus Portnoybacteria bacterium]|nr:hypothetical protein [Candidatus Portnoybacteria bacterium]
MNNPEQLNLQPVAGEVENNKEAEVKLSVDYQNIRNEAIAMMDVKMAIIKDELGAGSPEIAAYEAAKQKLGDNQFVSNLAKVNNWGKIREASDDIEEADKRLAKGLINAALELN